jgi:large subunit ribosomal protein L23
MENHEIVRYPLSTEKSIRLLEAENKLTFVVHPKATRNDIKKAVSEMFNAPVMKVNTFITPGGQKRAYVKLSMEFPAIDIATDLGLM